MGIIDDRLRARIEEEAARKSPLVWTDVKGEYTEIVADWSSGKEGPKYPLFAFNGSFLELMLAAREPLSRKHPSPCVVYLPGFAESDLSRTPFFEASCSGRCLRLPLDRLVREAGEGFLRSEQIDYILSRDNLTAIQADRLAAGMTARSPELDLALASQGEDGLIIAFLDGSLQASIGLSALRDHIDRVFGCTSAWMEEWTGNAAAASSREIAWALGAYLLCLEYACDLAVPPPDARISTLAHQDGEYRARAARILRALRRDKPELYTSLVEKTELGLSDQERSVPAEGLGTLDTFRFEANTVLDAALAALIRSDWDKAVSFSEPRLSGDSTGDSARAFWLAQEPARELIWKWIDATARLGKEIRNSCAGAASSLLAGMETYISGEWKIDSCHRAFKLLSNSINTQTFFPDIADFFAIRATVNRLYRDWADSRSRAWNDACAREGFNPPADLAQRRFFGRFVQPCLNEGKKTALILVDAMRYELGEELAALLSDYSGGARILSPLIAELPTITTVGMNALMPVERDGILDPVFDKSAKKILGFRAGERQVTDPASRRSALAERTSGQCEWTDLATFLDASDRPLKAMASASLLVITTQDIDSQGENGGGDLGIDYFQPVLARLREAVEKLRARNFERIFITSDHGFLIGDETVENAAASRLEGAERRHAFDIPRKGERLTSVTLADLGWKCESRDVALVFEKGTHLLTSARARTFYHGGNSPQERVIPLISLTGGMPLQSWNEKYRIILKALAPVFGTNRVEIHAESIATPELFAPDKVELRIIAEPGFKLLIGDAGGARFTGDSFECPVGTRIIVSFRLTSPVGGKSRISVIQTSSLVSADTSMSPEYFDAETGKTGSSMGASATAPESGPIDSPSAPQPVARAPAFVFPRDKIPAEYETAIMHLYRHEKLSESFLRNTLGDTPAASRKARSFAVRIEEWKNYLPFSVTIHSTADGNEYHKE